MRIKGIRVFPHTTLIIVRQLCTDICKDVMLSISNVTYVLGSNEAILGKESIDIIEWSCGQDNPEVGRKFRHPLSQK